MTSWRDHYYRSEDGLDLYARLYDRADSQRTILCMHGLTRNSRDFEAVANHLADRYRVIAVDQRGRGNSAWDSDLTRYNPQVYVKDMWTLLDGLAVPEVAMIGTSMGGLMAMMMGATVPKRTLGIVLNDIGPVLERSGLDRIKAYIGKTTSFDSWQQLADATKALNGAFFPRYSKEDWLAMARRTGTKTKDSKITLNYDPALAAPIMQSEEAAVPPDLWPLFDMLAPLPLMTVRGTISDLFSVDTLKEMKQRHPDMISHTVAEEGHAPMMDDPASLAAINVFMQSVFEGKN